MTRLADIEAAALRTALREVDDRRPTVRLVAAIAHQRGVSQRELADWLGVERKTVYNWLRRFEERPDDLVAAATDDPRPGRPPKLGPEGRDALSADLSNPPAAVGHDADEWTPALLEGHVEETYGVEYSRSTCRRLLAELAPA